MLSIKEFLAKRKSARQQADTGAVTSAPVIEPTDITFITDTETDTEEENDTEKVILVPSYVVIDEFSEYF